MDSANWRSIAKGACLTIIYFLFYLAGWLNSLDQWFLPAGIRGAAMLLVPYRYWPYLFLGDAAALMAIRFPISWQYSDYWAPASSLLLAPMISLVPISFRSRLKSVHANAAWLPLIAACFATWSSICNLLLNYALSGPSASKTPDVFLRYITGDSLGFLMVVPAAYVWLHRNSGEFPIKKTLIDSGVGISMIAVMYGATLSHEIAPAMKQLLLVMMIVPAIALTILHGWKGAAIGTAAANLAIGLSLPDFDFFRAHDETAFLAQQILALMSVALLLLGAKITALFNRARSLGISEQQAIELAQANSLAPEFKFRDTILQMAQMQIALDEQRHDIASTYRDLGYFQEALDLNSRGVEQKAKFEQHAMALYPILIEKEGLFSALHAEPITRFWAGDAEVMLLVKGQPKRLSVNLQYAAYYCIGNSIAFLRQFNPDYYEIRARAWRGRGRRGVSVTVTARPTTDAVKSDAAILAMIQLNGISKAYGGKVKRRRMHRFSIFLSEKDQSGSVQQHPFDHLFPIAH